MPLGTPIADRECTICNRYIAPAVDDLENHQARGCRLRNRTQQRLKQHTRRNTVKAGVR